MNFRVICAKISEKCFFDLIIIFLNSFLLFPSVHLIAKELTIISVPIQKSRSPLSLVPANDLSEPFVFNFEITLSSISPYFLLRQYHVHEPKVCLSPFHDVVWGRSLLHQVLQQVLLQVLQHLRFQEVGLLQRLRRLSLASPSFPSRPWLADLQLL